MSNQSEITLQIEAELIAQMISSLSSVVYAQYTVDDNIKVEIIARAGIRSGRYFYTADETTFGMALYPVLLGDMLSKINEVDTIFDLNYDISVNGIYCEDFPQMFETIEYVQSQKELVF